MKKEIVVPIKGFDNIKSITIGIFPKKGRYFREKMIRKDGKFVFELDVPEGISYYHLYLNDDFSKVFLDINTPKESWVPIITKSEIFTHINFSNNSRFVNYIKDDLIEIRLISYYTWIKSVQLVIDDSLIFDFSVCFEYQNKKYWSIRYEKGKQNNFAIKFGFDDRQYWLLKNHKASKIFDSLAVFEFPEFPNKKNITRLFNTGYQIFPDSFFKSKYQASNDYFVGWNSQPDNLRYFGGDVKGVFEKLDLIEKLGIDFIYFNPVFHGGSPHRYDTIDYRKIDPILGTEEDFDLLVKKLHSKKIKIILDISLNHCSLDFFAFRDILKYQEKSAYKEWFHINSFPLSIGNVNYSCWHGCRDLVQFNLDNEEVQEYLIESAIYWVKRFDIDGWRIDVSSELPDYFLNKFFNSIRDVKDTTVFIGENQHDDTESFLNLANGDGITAYGLYLDVFIQHFLDERINLIALVQSLMEYNYAHSFWAIQNSWNFLSNHDLPRFYSILKNKANCFLAFGLLFAIPGTPVLFYGEELMKCGDPKDTRCSMNWDEYNAKSSFHMFIKDLIGIRNNYKDIFMYGNIEIPFIDIDRDLLVVVRRFDNEMICFIMNFSDNPTDLDFIAIFGNTKLIKVLRGNHPISSKIINNKDSSILHLRVNSDFT